MIHAKIVSFTDKGAALGARVAASLPDMLAERYARGADVSVRQTALARFAQQAMADCDLIVFIGASGIAVRAVAPYLAGKQFDPAVLVLDEGGQFVISLLSGHLGGANEYARRLAGALGAQPVITTATDGRGVFAVDTWAKEQGMLVYEPERIRDISGALLRGESVGFCSEFPVEGRIPPRIETRGTFAAGFAVGFDCESAPFARTLHLIPRIVRLGIGCKRGTRAETVETAVKAALHMAKIPIEAVAGAASIDLKAEEAGLAAFCAAQGWRLLTFSAEELRAAKGEFTSSDFVRSAVGVDNVCERAAVLAAGNGRLLLRKTARDGVTVALAAEEWRVRF